MKRQFILFLSLILIILTVTAFEVRDTVTHSGVTIAAVPLTANGTLIKMDISSERENQTITSVTYELVDEETVNVHVNLDYLARSETKEEQTLQLLLPTETKVRFLVNEKQLNVYLDKEYGMWKTVQ